MIGSEPLEGCEKVSETMVNYVERSGESVVLEVRRKFKVKQYFN